MEKQVDYGAAFKKTKAPAKAAPYDMTPIKRELAKYDPEIARLAAEAEAHQVTDDATARTAVEMAGQCQAMAKRIEDQRKAIVEAPNKFVKAVNNFTKDYQGRFNDISTGLKKKITDYNYQREMARREAERRAQEEARALQERLRKEAEEKGFEAPEVTAPVMPKPETTTRTEDGSAYLKKTWAFEVVDAAAVPRDYCEPSEKIIRQAVAGGIREIPGVKIFEKVQTVIRT